MQRRAFQGALLALLVASGCGQTRRERIPVAGRVLIDGQPVKGGMINVLTAAGRPAGSVIQPDGSFSLSTFKPDDGCLPGKHPVEILAFDSLAGGNGRRWRVPQHYGKAATSNLWLEVTEPTDHALVELSWGDEQPVTEWLVDPSAPVASEGAYMPKKQDDKNAAP